VLQPASRTCLYLAAPRTTRAPTRRAGARSFFLGTTGVREDPATGSAARLAAYIAPDRRPPLNDLSVIRNQTLGPVSLFTYGTHEPFVGVYHPHTSTGTVHLPDAAA
jgi:predicted PhzF superfamily epimerase YddE/YHI9